MPGNEAIIKVVFPYTIIATTLRHIEEWWYSSWHILPRHKMGVVVQFMPDLIYPRHRTYSNNRVEQRMVFSAKKGQYLLLFGTESHVAYCPACSCCKIYTRCVPKDMKYIFLPLSYWSQPVLTGWLRWGGPLSS